MKRRLTSTGLRQRTVLRTMRKVSLLSRETQRTTPEVQAWYRSHETAGQIGFNPDGMCQKICRTARNIGPGAPSALASALLTPPEFRIKMEDIIVGDLMYFDDPKDSNPFGHVVTVMALDKTISPSNPRSKIVRTNSVQSGRIVAVRGDYFATHWGDPFQWGGRWLNGEPFYDLIEPAARPKPKPLPQWKRIERIINRLESMDDDLKNAIRVQEKMDNKRFARALRRDRITNRSRIKALKTEYNKARKANR